MLQGQQLGRLMARKQTCSEVSSSEGQMAMAEAGNKCSEVRLLTRLDVRKSWVEAHRFGRGNQ